jgi:hypothetical protein
MRTQFLAACCVLSLATCAVAANPTRRIGPGDKQALAAARLQVSCKILNAQDFPDNPHYAFEIWAWVPQGYHSLDAMVWIENDKGLLAQTPWRSSAGKCVATFTVGKQALKDAWFQVQWWRSDPIESGGWGAAGNYVLKLSEFAGEHDAAAADEASQIKNSN